MIWPVCEMINIKIEEIIPRVQLQNTHHKCIFKSHDGSLWISYASMLVHNWERDRHKSPSYHSKVADDFKSVLSVFLGRDSCPATDTSKLEKMTTGEKEKLSIIYLSIFPWKCNSRNLDLELVRMMPSNFNQFSFIQK